MGGCAILLVHRAAWRGLGEGRRRGRGRGGHLLKKEEQESKSKVASKQEQRVGKQK